MRYRATLANPKNPKQKIHVSIVAKSKKAAQSALKRLIPGLGGAKKSNPRKKRARRRARRRK
jgi:hypothetical protein